VKPSRAHSASGPSAWVPRGARRRPTSPITASAVQRRAPRGGAPPRKAPNPPRAGLRKSPLH
jgi:hypothetical protein